MSEYTKELTEKDIKCFNEMKKLLESSSSPSYIKYRKEEIFEQSDYISAVDFALDYMRWSNKAIQLTLF